MSEKRKIKINHRIISFLLCLVVLFTFTVNAPMHQPKAFAVEITLTALLLGLLTACGVQILTNNQEEIDAITQDVWSYMTQDRAYVKNTIEGYVNQVQHQYDPFTNTYIKSKFTIGTQEYMDIHEAVNSWAASNIIDGEITLNSYQSINVTRSEWTLNSSYTDQQNYNLSQFYIEPGNIYRFPYYLNNYVQGFIDYSFEIIKTSDNSFSYTSTHVLRNIDGTTETNVGTDNYNDRIYNDVKFTFNSIPSYTSIFFKLKNAITNETVYKKGNHYFYKQILGYWFYPFEQIPPTFELVINPDAPPIFVPANKNSWPYEIKQKWHLDNIENPTGTGEKEFTIDVENPYTNTIPTNVLPKDLTEGVNIPSVGEGTLAGDVTDIKNAVVTLSDTLADSISGAIDSINKMPFLPRITLSLMLFALLILMLIIACIFLVIRCIAWIGLMLVVPASAVGIDDDIMWGIQYAFDFNIADIITVRQLFTLMVSIFFGLSIIRYASKIKVNHT